MIIGGLQKTTLIDFPDTIACTVFTVGCNFRCPFCHNRDLVLLTSFRKSQLQEMREASFFDFLKKRKRYLDGVCITGGEPTIHSDLPVFIKKIKKIGYKVKLDTNGTNPSMLKFLYSQNLLDYVAMDIKSCYSLYTKAVNVRQPNYLELVKKSTSLILQSGKGFEFRTTVVPGIHDITNMVKLAQELVSIAVKHNYPVGQLLYYIQNFQAQNCLDSNYMGIVPFTDKELEKLLLVVKKIIPKARIRGEE